eukprot:m51a1_g13393 hypothetical protein (351) ;mRNA; f:450-2032
MTREQLRQMALDELTTTESAYLYDKPLRDSGIVPSQDSATLFGSVEPIRRLSYELLQSLRGKESVGSCFLRLAEYLKMYSVYCANFEAQIATLSRLSDSHPEFKAFIENVSRNPKCRQLDLAAFLIKPVQRVLKYPLLLAEIIKYTDDGPERNELEKARARIASVCDGINSWKRDFDSRMRLVDFQRHLITRSGRQASVLTPTRRVVREAVLRERMEQGTREVHYVLCTDVLLRALLVDGMDELVLMSVCPLCKVAPARPLNEEFGNNLILVMDEADNGDGAIFDIKGLVVTFGSREQRDSWFRELVEGAAQCVRPPSPQVSAVDKEIDEMFLCDQQAQTERPHSDSGAV